MDKSLAKTDKTLWIEFVESTPAHLKDLHVALQAHAYEEAAESARFLRESCRRLKYSKAAKLANALIKQLDSKSASSDSCARSLESLEREIAGLLTFEAGSRRRRAA